MENNLTPEEGFVKKFFDQKHPLLFRLRRDKGFALDDLIELMQKYGNQMYNQAIRDAAEVVTFTETKNSILKLLKPE